MRVLDGDTEIGLHSRLPEAATMFTGSTAQAAPRAARYRVTRLDG
jgi:hypothetical protein